MIRHTCVALIAIAVLSVSTVAQPQPTTVPAQRVDADAELDRLRAENAALRAALKGLILGPGNLQSRYNALKLDRDRAVEQLQIAQQQIADLQREIEALRERVQQAAPVAE